METFPGEIWGIDFGHLNVSEAMRAMATFGIGVEEIQTEMDLRPNVFLWKGETTDIEDMIGD